MAQVFDRSSNALIRASLALTGLFIVMTGVTLNYLQRSPWVTRQGQRADQYCHTSVEKSSYAGIPPTKTCMNCHSQIWTDAQLLEPVRESWATGESIQWTRVHDLPDFVYFNHEIHVNKGIGCASCHGRVDEMPIMYAENTLQMEWCLNCHRNPAKNLRPTSEIYNMAWAGPDENRPVWCATTGKPGPTAGDVSCVTTDPTLKNPQLAMLLQRDSSDASPEGEKRSGGMAGGGQSGFPANPIAENGSGQTVSDMPQIALPAQYVKFTDQIALGHFLMDQYHIRTANELSSCEVCHR
jgi:hypothetical protein